MSAEEAPSATPSLLALPAPRPSTLQEPVGPRLEDLATRVGGRVGASWLRTLLVVATVGYVVLVLALTAIGEGIVHAGFLSGLRQWDESVNHWLAEHRTGALDGFTSAWTKLMDTLPAVCVALVVEAKLALRRRWDDMLLVVTGLALELAVFLSVNALVDRPRPDVERLGSLPNTSSFPSGHVAATIVLYGSIALFVTLARRGATVQWLAWSGVVLFAGCVAFSRVYRGMHHPSDVLAGMVLGIACLVVAAVASRAAAASRTAPTRASAPR